MKVTVCELLITLHFQEGTILTKLFFVKVKIVNAFRDRRQPACGTAYVCGYMATFFDESSKTNRDIENRL